MKKYTIFIYTRPHEYIIKAENKEEAIEKAKEKFYIETEGGVWESVVDNVEELD